jgi:hypothetical protein
MSVLHVVETVSLLVPIASALALAAMGTLVLTATTLERAATACLRTRLSVQTVRPRSFSQSSCRASQLALARIRAR